MAQLDKRTTYTDPVLTALGYSLTKFSFNATEDTTKGELIGSLGTLFGVKATDDVLPASTCIPFGIQRGNHQWHFGEQAQNTAGPASGNTFWGSQKMIAQIWVLHPDTGVNMASWPDDTPPEANEDGLSSARRQVLEKLLTDEVMPDLLHKLLTP